MSALIAASEIQPASGSDFLAALIVGYEVAARVAMAVGPEAHYRRGFHPTGTCGVFGTAAAVSRLWGLDTDATANALGIAGSRRDGRARQSPVKGSSSDGVQALRNSG